MGIDNIGVDEFTSEELEELFRDDTQPETPPVNDQQTDPQNDTADNDNIDGQDNKSKPAVDTTKAFAQRLKQSTNKAITEERERIAKSLGYSSYEELQKNNEKKILEDKGLDADIAADAIDELVKKRIENDPRIKELEELRKQRVKEFGDRELKEISNLTNGEITKFEQLPKEVIDLWTKKGSLKAAYMELEGEKLINKIRGEQSKGSTQHLKSPSGGSNKNNVRTLTDDEKRVWKVFNPHMTDEELDKITVEKN